MAKKRIIRLEDDEDSNFEKIKHEIITMVTGQEMREGKAIDYYALLKRVTIILIAIYGIGKFQIVRRFAVSIVTTMVTKWLAEKAIDEAEGNHPIQLAN
jgi:hypothetical protein